MIQSIDSPNDLFQQISNDILRDNNDSEIIQTTLEYLPDEILLEIIHYLKPYDIYHSLYE